jgi:hypothetical protein
MTSERLLEYLKLLYNELAAPAGSEKAVNGTQHSHTLCSHMN